MTLVEVLVAVTLTSFVLGIVGVLLSTVWKAELASREQRNFARTVATVAEQVRRDAHAALPDSTAAAIGEEPADAVTLVLADGSIVAYSSDGERIDRVEKRGDEVIRREAYRLPRGTKSTWRHLSIEGQPSIRLSIHRGSVSNKTSDGVDRMMHVDGLLGLTAELTAGPKS